MNKITTLFPLYIPKHSRWGRRARRAAALMAKAPATLRRMKKAACDTLRLLEGWGEKEIPDALMAPLGGASGLMLGLLLFLCYFG